MDKITSFQQGQNISGLINTLHFKVSCVELISYEDFRYIMENGTTEDQRLLLNMLLRTLSIDGLSITEENVFNLLVRFFDSPINPEQIKELIYKSIGYPEDVERQLELTGDSIECIFAIDVTEV